MILSHLSSLLLALAFAGVLVGTYFEAPAASDAVTPVDPKIRSMVTSYSNRPKASVMLFIPPRPRGYSVREGSRSYSSRRRSMNSGGYRSGK